MWGQKDVDIFNLQLFKWKFGLLQDSAKTHGAVLACTDGAVLSVNQALEAIRELGIEGVQQSDPLVITSASLLSNYPHSSFFVCISVLHPFCLITYTDFD